jgi:hypothetical protein
MAQQKINYSFANDGLGDPLRQAFVKTDGNFDELYANKVDKVVGKGLSDVNFTQIDKDKLDDLDPSARVQGDFTENNSLNPAFIKNKPTKLSQFDNDLDFVEDVVIGGLYARSAGTWISINNGAPSNLFKFIQKGYGNSLSTPESGDIYCGWKNDGTVRYTEALYISGSLDNSDNFTPLVQTSLI